MKRGVKVLLGLFVALSLFVTGCGITTSANQEMWDFIKQTFGNFLQELFSGSINDTALAVVVGFLFIGVLWPFFYQLLKKFDFFGKPGIVSTAGLWLTFSAATLGSLSIMLAATKGGTIGLRESTLALISPFGAFGSLGLVVLTMVVVFLALRNANLASGGAGVAVAIIGTILTALFVWAWMNGHNITAYIAIGLIVAGLIFVAVMRFSGGGGTNPNPTGNRTVNPFNPTGSGGGNNGGGPGGNGQGNQNNNGNGNNPHNPFNVPLSAAAIASLQQDIQMRQQQQQAFQQSMNQFQATMQSVVSMQREIVQDLRTFAQTNNSRDLENAQAKVNQIHPIAEQGVAQAQAISDISHVAQQGILVEGPWVDLNESVGKIKEDLMWAVSQEVPETTQRPRVGAGAQAFSPSSEPQFKSPESGAPMPVSLWAGKLESYTQGLVQDQQRVSVGVENAQAALTQKIRDDEEAKRDIEASYFKFQKALEQEADLTINSITSIEEARVKAQQAYNGVHTQGLVHPAQVEQNLEQCREEIIKTAAWIEHSQQQEKKLSKFLNESLGQEIKSQKDYLEQILRGVNSILSDRKFSGLDVQEEIKAIIGSLENLENYTKKILGHIRDLKRQQ